MKSSILVTPTDSVKGLEIERYIEFISTNVVVGTNLFSDAGASLIDFFGGMSNSYQEKLDKIQKVGIDKLKHKAQNLGANGIISLRTDFDEISGKGKSMFMVSISGMAVRFTQNQSIDSKVEIALPDDLDIEISKIKISEVIRNGSLPSEEEWTFLLSNPIPEIIPDLLNSYLKRFEHYSSPINDIEKTARNFFPLILKNLDEEFVSDILYSKLIEITDLKKKENIIVIKTLIEESQTFAVKWIIKMIADGKKSSAILTLNSNKRSFKKSDSEEFKKVLNILDNLPDTGKIEMVKSLLGTKEKYICESNHTSDSSSKYCNNVDCGKNIKGLISSEIAIIEEFRIKVKALENIFN
ncbi:YbjQ family protein [Algoriphagus sp. AK58]|uniref:YbjQ family protein n=1 Tax=Algoriphagus sp. AK58 TaxID=1406877 RepID=UPI0016500363|nr:heavy metal-binding domain-containing protein [Algoriphagus sp. AK58]MBC6365803.1 hypothetical protein [Algoriphagus sp. AK58]